MNIRGILTALILLATGGCSTQYPKPIFDASPDTGTQFLGVVDQAKAGRPLDVVLIHGMCTHDKAWAHGAVARLYSSLGGDGALVNLQFASVSKTKVELYQQTLQTAFGELRVNAIVWSPLTTPLKKQLCYDQSNRSGYCTEVDTPKPYPYIRATLNRTLKDTILNDCLSDALAYQGLARDEISSQMQSAVLQALATSGGSKSVDDSDSMVRRIAQADSQTPLVVISESLGSKVIFDAIYKLTRSGDSDTRAAGVRTFDRISQIFMGANQLPILALSDQHLDGSLGISRNAERFPEDAIGALFRARALRTRAGTALKSPSVVAFTDPNDLLSYVLAASPHRDRQNYPVIDVVISNDLTYFGIAELPTTAHLGYQENTWVNRLIACGNPMSQRCQW